MKYHYTVPLSFLLATACVFFHRPFTASGAMPAADTSICINSAINFSTASGPRSCFNADFNRDGFEDLATANYISDNVSILLGTGTGSFGSATNFTAGDGPKSLTGADFNGDGIIDLAVANSSSNNISILLGTGTGSFGAPTNIALGVTNPGGIINADFNRDGKADLALAIIGSNCISILLGDGTGGFGAVSNYASGNNPQSIISADFNKDGIPDLAAANQTSNNVSVFLGTGTGTMNAATNFSVGTTPQSVTSGDFNGDGIADLATANFSSNDVSVLLGIGTGTFIPATSFSAGTGPRSIICEDLNKDGNKDLAIANSGLSILMGVGSGNFSLAINFSAGSSPLSVLCADFNLDGKVDLALANNASNNISLLTNCTPVCMGNFGYRTNFATGLAPQRLVCSDFNADGIIDVAVANQSSSNVSILLGTGTGSFGSATNFLAGSQPVAITSADFNRDGKIDLAVANFWSNNMSVLLGTGTGSFGAATNFAAGSLPRSVCSGDFNGDGIADLAVTNEGSGNISVFLGTGTGSFGAATNFSAGSIPFTVISADFNRDGKADLATANAGASDISVLLGTGTGSFGAASLISVGSSPRSLVCADFNIDGKLDLVAANLSSNNVSVLLGTGTGTFGAPTNYTVGTSPYSVTDADFNGDGKADLAVINNNSDNISLLIGTGNGTFGAVTTFGVHFSPCFIAHADFNRDGKLDLVSVNSGSDDISVLLNVPIVPSVNAGLDRTVCQGTSVTLSGSGATTYVWNNGITNGVAFTPPIGTTTYTVTGTDGNACSNTDAVNVTANPLPGNAGTISGIATVCQGQNSVTYTVPVITNATSYVWTLRPGASGSSTTRNITVNYGTSAASGNITVKGHNSCGDGVVSTLSITVNPLPGDAGSIFGDTIVCQGQEYAYYYVDPIAYADTYIWTLPSGATDLDSLGIESIIVSYNSSAVSGNIIVNGNNSCGDGAISFLAITVNPKPAAPLIGTITSSLCSVPTGSVVLNGLPAAGAWTITRNPGGTTTTGSGTSTTVSGLPAGNYTFTVTNSYGCSSAPSATVIINSTPNAPIIDQFNTGYNGHGGTSSCWQSFTPGMSGRLVTIEMICNGINDTIRNVTLDIYQGQGKTGPLIYSKPGLDIFLRGFTWMTVPIDIPVNLIKDNLYTIVFTTQGEQLSWWASSSNPYPKGISSLGAGWDQAFKTWMEPSIADAGTDIEICPGDSATLHASGGTWYAWSPVSGLNSINIPDPVASPSSTTAYTVTVTDAFSCTGSDVVVVTVKSLPAAIIIPAGSVSFCAGDSDSLSANLAGSYLWSTAETTQSIVADSSGAYSVTVTDWNGCSAASAPTVVTVNPLPIASITPDGPTTFCSGDTVKLTACAASSFTWSTGATIQSIMVTLTGNYMVTITDENGCTASASQIVHSDDNEPPIINCPANITTNNAPGLCTAIITYTTPVGTDNCPGAVTTQISGLASGAAFPKGSTTNCFKVTDALGNTSTCSFIVRVNDVQSPTISCPTNISVNNTYGLCSALVTYIAPAGTDNCSGAATTQTSGLGSGSTFPLGTTTNIFKVTDAAGNSATCAFTVTVIDNQLPTTNCPANITANNDLNICGAYTTFNVTSNDNCPGQSLTRIAGLASGSLFPIGNTTNIFKVTDASGNTASCSFKVTVIENQIPAILCPANISVHCNVNTCGATVTYNVTSMDNCAGQVTIQTAGLSSGSTFPLGTTTNTFKVTDASGNSATCAFAVTVTDNQIPAITCPSDVSVSTYSVTCSHAGIILGSAVTSDNCPGTMVSNNGLLIYPLDTTIVTWTITDASGNSATCKQSVFVDGQPLAIDDLVTTIEDNQVSGNVMTNDSGLCNIPITASDYTHPVNGMVVLNPNGTYTYTPNQNYYGTDSFHYIICDADGDCDTASVTITVNPNNDPPVTFDEHEYILEDTPLNDNILINGDYDPEGTVLTVSTTPVYGPNNGTIVVSVNGDYVYTPDMLFFGQDTVVISLCDHGIPLPQLCSDDTIFITVGPFNNPPVTVNEYHSITENGSATGDVTSGGDYDPDGTVLTTDTIPVTGPMHGTIVINNNGNYTYTPDLNYYGYDLIVTEICDAGIPGISCVTDTIFIVITKVNDPPVTNNEHIFMVENTQLTGNVLSNGDSDPDGTSLSINTTPVKYPVNGTILLSSNGAYTYIPDSNFAGSDTIVIGVCDSGTPMPAACSNDTVFIGVSNLSAGGPYGPYCVYQAPVTLTGSPVSGRFSGPGVTGNQFNPAAAGPGNHVITYTSIAAYDSTIHTATTTIVYSGAQMMGCGCNLCNQDYICFGNTEGPCTDQSQKNKWFHDPLPAGALVRNITVTYFGSECYSTSVPTSINNVPVCSAVLTVGNHTCACGTCNQVSCESSDYPNGIPGYHYGGSNKLSANPDGSSACFQRVEITISYLVNALGAGDSISTTTTITVYPVTAATAGSNSPLCTGDSLLLTGGGGISYLWSGPNGFNSTMQNPFLNNVNAAASGSYSVTVTDLNGCTASASTTVTVNSLPTATISSNSPVCEGLTLELHATGGSDYDWEGPDGWTVYVNPDPTRPGITHVEAGTYRVTVSDANGCEAELSTNVVVNTFASFFDVFLETMGTVPTNVSINQHEAANGFDNDAFTITGQGSLNNAVPSTGYTGASGLANVFLTNTGGDYFQIGGMNTTGLINLSLSFGIQKNSTLSNGSELAVEYSTDGINYSALTIPLLPTGTGSTVWYYRTCSGTIPSAPNLNIRWRNTAAGGPQFRIDDVKLAGGSSTANITASGPTAFCQGGTVMLTAIPGSSYLWNTAAITQAITVAGSDTYTVTISDANGCTASAEAPVIVYPLPPADAGANQLICAGTSVTLNASGGTTYVWNNGVVQGLPFTPTSTKTYIVTVTDANNCNTTDSVTVTINPLPPANAGTDQSVCAGKSVTLTATGGTSYVWNNGVLQGVSFIPTSTATYTVTVTGANLCSATDAVVVTVNPVPAANAGTDQTTCAGQQVVLIATGGTNYTWSGGVTQGLPFVPASTATYTVTVTNSFQCTATDDVNVTVNPNPVASASVDQNICKGTTVMLTASGGISYLWSTGATDADINVSPLTTTIFVVSVTNGYGCISTDDVRVTVYPLPQVNAGSYGPFCVNAPAVALNSGLPAGGYYSGPGVAANTFTPSNAGAGTHNIIYTYTDANNCTNSASTIIAVNGLPLPTANSNSPACENGVLNLYSGGGTTYQWSGPGGFSSSLQNPIISMAVPAASGNYTVTVTSAPGCSASALTVVIVNSAPVITIGSNSPLCAGYQLDLTAGGGTGYLWSGPNGFISPLQNPSIPNVTPAATGIYSVNVTNSAGCSSTTSIAVLVNNFGSTYNLFTETIGDSPVSVSIASYESANGFDNDAFTMTGAGSVNNGVPSNYSGASGLASVVIPNTNGSKYFQIANIPTSGITNMVLSFGMHKNTTASNGSELLVEVSSDGVNYTLLSKPLLPTGFGTNKWYYVSCSGSIPAVPNLRIRFRSTCGGLVGQPQFRVDDVRLAGSISNALIIPSGPTTFCQGNSVTLLASLGSSYSWSTQVHTQSIIAKNTGTYTVTITDANGCTASASQPVTVMPPPLASASSSNGPLCINNKLYLYSSGGISYSWTGPNSFTSALQNPIIPSVTVAASGTYTVTVTGSNGCTASATTAVTVNNAYAPALNINGSNQPTLVICPGGSGNLIATGATAYTWSTGSTSTTITVYSAGTYVVTGTMGGCTNTASATVTVAPIVTATANPAIVNSGQLSVLTAMGATTYTWSNGLGSGNPKNVYPTQTTTYTVTGSLSNGCKNTATVVVTVNGNKALVLDQATDQFNKGGLITVFDCYPNPFNEMTTVRFIFTADDHARLDVYDLTGKWLQTLFEADVAAEKEYTVEFDGKALSTGVYICRMMSNENVFISKMIISRQ